MRLFIANPTRQTQVVHYRLDLDEAGGRNPNSRFQPARQQEVRPGRQVQLGGDMHLDQVNEVIDQLKIYGIIGVVDTKRLKAADLNNLRRSVVPYIFNIDQPVPAEAIRTVKDHNEALLVRDGGKRREKAAVASSDLIQKTVAQQFAEAGIPAEPSNRQTFGIEQEEQSEAGERPIAEGFRIDPNAPAPKGKGKGGGKRR